ncbi:translation initiation factor eIF-2B subunit delta-like [Saccostrea cucullata]|uniref:translation initiation factor eIF-2B subunit delta-like n=1 Tax=Saccostrea cuccullata TaxID=36930 RepID=UPI002ED23D56
MAEKQEGALPTEHKSEKSAPTEKHDKKAKKEKKVKKEGKEGHPKDKTDKADPNQPQKSKAELKAERRAKQEAQRAAKQEKLEAAGAGGKKEGTAVNTKKDASSSSGKESSAASTAKKEPKRVPDHLKADDAETQKRVAKKLEKQRLPQRTVAQRKVRLFNHLHQYEREVSLTESFSFSSVGIHPVVIKLGLQYAEGVICGSNARCLAMLAAFKQVIRDYTTPPQKELSRDLEAKLKPCITFLNQCRLMSVSMGNAVKHLKHHITHMPNNLQDREAKDRLLDTIDNYIKERILLSAVAISKYVKDEEKIKNGDVILVYSCSSIVRRVLCDAWNQGKEFKVIVVDARPKMEGKEMLRRLVRAGIPCSYILINAASYAMQEATKVMLGAHALLANGCVMSRVGTSQIALIAKACNVPVLVCCETYKFCERGQTDSFVYNELGDPDDLVSIGNKTPYLNDWRDYSPLTLLNLVYDVTPPEFISLVITELGLIPCTSVPVVLRMKQAETNET